jgi:Ankyrin repeats (3 copies)
MSFAKHRWNSAAKYGDFEGIKFLHENTYEGCTFNVMDIAAENGHLDIVKFLHFNRPEGCTKNAIIFASKNEHIEVVKFLSEFNTESDINK